MKQVISKGNILRLGNRHQAIVTVLVRAQESGVVDDHRVPDAATLEVGAVVERVEMPDQDQSRGIYRHVLPLGVHSFNSEGYLVYDIENVSSQAKPFVW